MTSEGERTVERFYADMRADLRARVESGELEFPVWYEAQDRWGKRLARFQVYPSADAATRERTAEEACARAGRFAAHAWAKYRGCIVRL